VLIVATMNRCDRHFVISVVGNPERRLTILIERRGERQLWGQNRKQPILNQASAKRRKRTSKSGKWTGQNRPTWDLHDRATERAAPPENGRSDPVRPGAM